MCGRYYIAPADPAIRRLIEEMNRTQLAERFRKDAGARILTEGEITPASVVPAMATSRTGERRVFPMKWGFSSSGSGKLLINARAETAAEKPTFRESWAAHRCAVPASWYFEWEHDERKRPGRKFALRPAGSGTGESGIAWLAGLYRLEEGVPAFVIVTREADESLRWMHDRIPLILTEQDAQRWILPGEAPEKAAEHCLTRLDWQPA